MGNPAMKKFLLPAILLTVSIFALSLFTQSKAHAWSRPSGTKKNETYMVIKVTDENKTENKVEYKAISKTQLKDEQKRAADDFKSKLKEWHDLRKTDPTAPMPKRIKIEKLKDNYETQKIAQEYADKLRDELLGKDNGDHKKDVRK
jgi:hypothetical protein